MPMKSRLFALFILALALIAAWSPKPLTIPEGGTGGATAAAARDGIEHASAATIACASPCTPGTGIKIVTVSGTVTINLPTTSTYADGQQLLAHCDSASSCTVTFDPSDSATCDGGSAGAACSAITVMAHGVAGIRRTGSSAWGSVQPGSVTATAAMTGLTGGAWYAWGGVVTASGTFQKTTAAVAMTGAGTDYTPTLSGTSLILTGPLVGDTGAIQSNNQRWSVSLSSLGITLTTSGSRWVRTLCLTSSITDNSEARAGTVGWGSYQSVGGSTTALAGASTYRLSTGTSYGTQAWQTTATSETNVGSNTNTKGTRQDYTWPSDAGTMHASELSGTGAVLGTLSTGGSAISASVPDTLVVYIRSSASASGARFNDPRCIWQWSADISASLP